MTDNQNAKPAACCPSRPNCCNSRSSDQSAIKRHICIDFMYLDLSICSRCQGTDNSLSDALAEVAAVLKAADIDVTVNKIHVTSGEQACRLKFASSPTIRVNGRDIQMDVRESLCESCGDLCGNEVDCRVWIYQGQEYTVPPKAMIIDAILREVFGDSKPASSSENFVVPNNLKKFFNSMQQKEGSKA